MPRGRWQLVATTYLSLRNHDVLTIEGTHNRASATLIVESEPAYIDVVLSQTNNEWWY